MPLGSDLYRLCTIRWALGPLFGDCSSVQSFTDLIFQPPKVGPIELSDDDLIAVYEPTNQSVKTVTRKEFNQMK